MAVQFILSGSGIEHDFVRIQEGWKVWVNTGRSVRARFIVSLEWKEWRKNFFHRNGIISVVACERMNTYIIFSEQRIIDAIWARIRLSNSHHSIFHPIVFLQQVSSFIGARPASL
jgi:hypothetical protein